MEQAPLRERGQTAADRYKSLESLRGPFLLRAQDCAKLTIPSILPPQGHTHTSRLPQPYQGLGARGTTNLANRLTEASLPAGMNHFRLSVPAEVLVKEGTLTVPQELQNQLATTENLIQSEVDRLNWREATNLTAQHLVVTGNALEHMLPDGNLRVYRIDQFVVVRDHVGNLSEGICKEIFSVDALPRRLRQVYAADAKGDLKEVALYTWFVRQDDMTWKVHQELEDKPVPGSLGTYKDGALPFWHLRWAAVVGEDYGRGKIEEHYADLKALDGLTKALIDGAAMAARNLTMIRPNSAGGLNLRRRISKADNGDLIIGNPEDVTMLQFTNTSGMQFVAQQVAVFRQELGAAFLLGSAVRRNAERVTAEEIRRDAEELDGSLGGVYSVLSQDMSRPRLNRLIFQMQAAGRLPDWKQGHVEPLVLTGVAALGRERDIQRVGTALSIVAAVPDDVKRMYPKWSEILDKVFVAVGLPEAVRSDSEVQQMQERESLIQALQQTAPTVADKMLPSADAGAQPAPPA